MHISYQFLFLFAFIFTLPFNVSAIEFVKVTGSDNWIKKEYIEQGCIAYQGSSQPIQTIWVGDCTPSIPHGKGYLIENGVLFSAGINQGRVYRKEAASESADIEIYSNKAKYLAAYYAVIFAPQDKGLPPNQSTLSKRVNYFINSFPNATEQDKKEVIDRLNIDEIRLLNEGFEQAQNSNNPRTIAAYLSNWEMRLSKEKINLLKNRQTRIENEERVASAKREAEERKAAAAQEQLRDKMRITACSLYYPGYVGQYKGTGWLATADTYVVRYVNTNTKSVTIEGRDSGNSLKFGQTAEMSCFTLWERTK